MKKALLITLSCLSVSSLAFLPDDISSGANLEESFKKAYIAKEGPYPELTVIAIKALPVSVIRSIILGSLSVAPEEKYREILVMSLVAEPNFIDVILTAASDAGVASGVMSAASLEAAKILGSQGYVEKIIKNKIPMPRKPDIFGEITGRILMPLENNINDTSNGTGDTGTGDTGTGGIPTIPPGGGGNPDSTSPN